MSRLEPTSVRLRTPSFAEAWPPGLRPTRLRATPSAISLLYLHPDGAWVEVWLDSEGDRVRVRPGDGEGFDATAKSRLSAALLRRLQLTLPESLRWIAHATAFAASCVGVVPTTARTNDGIRVLTAQTDLVSALEGFDPDAPVDSEDPCALACRAFLSALAGLPALAAEQAERAAEHARGSCERTAIGRLLLALDRHASAAACLEAGTKEGHVPLAVLARAAALAHAPEQTLAAVRRLLAAGVAGRDRDQALNALMVCGAHGEARDVMRAVCAGDPSATELGRLAELHLFTLDLEQAEHTAQRALELADDARARLVLGAVAVARGAHEQGLTGLSTLEGSDHQATARLWSMRALLALGRIEEAVTLACSGGFADRVPWKLWRGYAEALAAPDETLRGKEAYQLRIILEHTFGAQEAARAYETNESAIALIRRAIDSLGGNYTEAPTFLRDGELFAVAFESPRNQAIAAQLLVPTAAGIEGAIAELDAQAVRMPSSPYPRTYRAELLLWRGDYDAARSEFEEIWQRSRTRWGYVGLGACLAMLGRSAEALAAWEEGLAHYTYLRQEGTYAYRADVLLDLGRLDAAAADAEHAALAAGSRVGAWAVLAVARARMGDSVGAREALDRLAERAPGLLCFAASSVELAPRSSDLTALLAIAERIRRALAGNRASKVYTFVDDSGRLRALRSVPAAHWNTTATYLAPLALDVVAKAT